MVVPRGQLQYEWAHLLLKLRIRDKERSRQLEAVKRPRPHPLFRVVPGGVEEWEKVAVAPPSEAADGATRRR